MTGPDRAPDRYVTVAQAADLTGAQPRTIRRWISRGRLAVRTGPHGRLVELAAVERLVAERLDGDPIIADTLTGPARIVTDTDHGQGRTAIRNGPDHDLGELVGLIERQQQTILELSGRLGWMSKELELERERSRDLEQQVKLLSAPTYNSFKSDDPVPTSTIVDTPDPASTSTAHRSAPEQNGPRIEAQQPQRRPWWRFW